MSEKLRPVPVNSASDTEVDVVFVHGLGGDGFKTWTRDANNQEMYWPQWVSESIPNFKVWSLYYPARMTNWNSSKGRAMSLTDRANSVVGLLNAKRSWEAPCYFYRSQFRWIISKENLQSSASFGVENEHNIASNTIAVIFLATPNRGSNLASLAAGLAQAQVGPISLSWLLRWSPHIRALRRDDDSLQELHKWYANNARSLNISTVSFYETEPVGPHL